MQFLVRGVQGSDEWIVDFLEVDIKTSVGRIRTFKTEEKIRQMARSPPTRQSRAKPRCPW